MFALPKVNGKNNASTKVKSKSRSKAQNNNYYQLSNQQFRAEYRNKFSNKQDHEWKNHKEICFQHVLLPLLHKYHLCPNQVPSFESNKYHYSPLSLPCTDTSCNKISGEYIVQHHMKKRFCVTMRSLNIGWSSKNKDMDDLCVEVYDANKHCMISQQKYKLMKLMARDIKRYTESLTQKDVVCSVVFDKSELFMVIHESKPRVVMSIGIRKDQNWANYGIKKDQNFQPPSDIATLWYKAWGLSGIQEVSILFLYNKTKLSRSLSMNRI